MPSSTSSPSLTLHRNQGYGGYQQGPPPPQNYRPPPSPQPQYGGPPRPVRRSASSLERSELTEQPPSPGYGGGGYNQGPPPQQGYGPGPGPGRPGLPTVSTNAYVQGNHNAPPPPPQGLQGFGHGAPQGYGFQYSNCTGRRKALLIGINYFRQRGELRGCINDVKNLSAYLNENFGYAREDMVILTDDQKNPMSQPTRRNIIRAMHWLVKDARPHDSLFFHYSGALLLQGSAAHFLTAPQAMAIRFQTPTVTRTTATTRSSARSTSRTRASSSTTRCTTSCERHAQDHAFSR